MVGEPDWQHCTQGIDTETGQIDWIQRFQLQDQSLMHHHVYLTMLLLSVTVSVTPN